MTTPLTDQELQELRACADAAGLSHELSVLLFKAERKQAQLQAQEAERTERIEMARIAAHSEKPVAWLSEDGNRLSFHQHLDYTRPLKEIK